MRSNGQKPKSSTVRSSRSKGFPGKHKVKLFRVVLSTKRTHYVVTNDMAQDNTQAAQEVCGFRWKVEQFHRKIKQLTGLEGCQCRKARIVRNHIACAILVWVRLKQVADATKQTVYRLKHGLLSDYLRQQLKSPAILMTFALVLLLKKLDPFCESNRNALLLSHE